MRQLATLRWFAIFGSALLAACSPDVPEPGTPVLHLVTPAMGPDEGGLDIALDGENFAQDTRVTVCGTPASYVTVTAPTHLIATLPACPGKLGMAEIVVKNPDGQSATRSDLFVYHGTPSVTAKP